MKDHTYPHLLQSFAPYLPSSPNSHASGDNNHEVLVFVCREYLVASVVRDSDAYFIIAEKTLSAFLLLVLLRQSMSVHSIAEGEWHEQNSTGFNNQGPGLVGVRYVANRDSRIPLSSMSRVNR